MEQRTKTLGIDRNIGIVLGVVLFIFGSILGFSFNYNFIRIEQFNFDVLFWSMALISVVIHELTHCICYRVAGGLRKKDIELKVDTKFDVPYFKVKKIIHKKALIISLISPLIISTIFILIINYLTNNLSYLFLYGFCLAMSSADIIMAFKIMRHDKSSWISTKGRFGFEWV